MIKKIPNIVKQFIEKGGYKSVICLNSNIPKIVSDLGLPIIATDGAVNNLLKYHDIYPNFVVGDMDSISQSAYEKCQIVQIDDQDSTDFDKAISFAKDNDFSPFIVTGLDGGFLDHSLNNFSIFSSCSFLNTLYISDKNFGFCVHNNSMEISLPIDTKMSIFGAPSATVSTTGLKWNLKRKQLSFFDYNSCSNRVASPIVNITAEDGQVFVFIYIQKINDAGSIQSLKRLTPPHKM